MARVVALCALVAAMAASTARADAVPRSDLIHHHSLEPPYVHDWWEEGVPHWDIGGDTVATNDFVRLTPQRASRFGWMWNNQRNDNQWWEARVQFYARSRQNPGADGLAFWYVRDPYKGQDGPGPLFGMKRDFMGIGVLFDSYDNDNMRDNPATVLVSNLKGDKNNWDMDTDLLDQATFRCLFEHRNTPQGDPVEMVLSYYEKKLTLRLRHSMRSHTETFCGEIGDIDLPQDYVFGATATTGSLSDNHDIVSIEVRSLGDTVGDAERPAGEEMQHAQQQEPAQASGIVPKKAGPKRPEPKHFDHGADAKEKDFWKAKDPAPDADKQGQ